MRFPWNFILDEPVTVDDDMEPCRPWVGEVGDASGVVSGGVQRDIENERNGKYIYISFLIRCLGASSRRWRSGKVMGWDFLLGERLFIIIRVAD
jgi:hypothetical protein